MQQMPGSLSRHARLCKETPAGQNNEVVSNGGIIIMASGTLSDNIKGKDKKESGIIDVKNAY